MDHGSSREKSSDVFSFSDDEELTHRVRFIKEVGFGNWGSVWKCEPRSAEALTTGDSFDQTLRRCFAVKLVHRRGEKPEEIKTSAARVKSLWNEMRIVRQFKSDPHPSIIPFYSFLLTPSYALVTMAYYPDLITVQVAETYARTWFRFLLSAVDYLHKRGVVHNDIKPANILMSPKGVPVLCDFGFAESYDLESTSAFHSRCSYGTPEYLSPERARGIPHDTRKSDVWSLGVTFFEILVGRTPFEESDTDNCLTHEDLEKYWSRTLRGKWVGSWKMSKGVERLLRRMLAPNADLRCTAAEAIKDIYWASDPQSSQHRKSSSIGSSIVFEKDISKLMDVSTSWTSPKSAGTSKPPPGLASPDSSARSKTIVKAKSQPKVNATTKAPVRKRVPVPKQVDLSPIKGSPPTSPDAQGRTVPNSTAHKRQPFGARDNVLAPRVGTKPSIDHIAERHKGRMLADLSGPPRKGKGKENHVTQRVQDWERERERLREMSRLEDLERETDAEEQVQEQTQSTEILGDLKKEDEREVAHEPERNEDISRPDISTLSLPQIPISSPMRVPSVHVLALDSEPSMLQQPVVEKRRSGFLTHRIRASIDKTMQKYKSSTLGRNNSSRTRLDRPEDLESRNDHSERESWEDDALIREAKSSLPVVRQAIHNERVGADNQTDRLTLWMRNVERVVEDARESFNHGQTSTLPPLPLPPASKPRSNRSSRLPRKVLAANEIFSDTSLLDASMVDRSMSSYVASISTNPTSVEPDTKPQSPNTFLQSPKAIPLPATPPSRPRRATVSITSPENVPSDPFEFDQSPSKRKEKSRSHGNLLQRHIAPPSELAAALNRDPVILSSPRLSEAVDRSIFIASSVRSREDVDHLNTPPPFSKSFDELTSSPLVVEPYPPRDTNATQQSTVPDTPTQRKLEGVYDRFLMATSGVKRVGKGYQSDINGPVLNTMKTQPVAPPRHRVFYSTRRQMPPPVSSEQMALVVDEMGVMSSTPVPGAIDHGVLKDQSNNTVANLRRAFKAMVPGKTLNRRLSRLS